MNLPDLLVRIAVLDKRVTKGSSQDDADFIAEARALIPECRQRIEQLVALTQRLADVEIPTIPAAASVMFFSARAIARETLKQFGVPAQDAPTREGKG